MKLSVKKDLAPLKAAAISEVDRQAGVARSAYITVAPGQEMVYLEKRTEAELIVGAADPAAIPAGETPHIALEAELNGTSRMEAAIVILTMAQRWSEVSSRIEIDRLSAKVAIEAATTPAQIEAAMPKWGNVS